MYIAAFQLFEEPCEIKCGSKEVVTKWAASKLRYYWLQNISWEQESFERNKASGSFTSEDQQDYNQNIKLIQEIDSHTDSMEDSQTLIVLGDYFLKAMMGKVIIAEITDGLELDLC